MKVTIEIECSPDEARQFLGLPDVKPMQAALMVKMETQMADAADRFAPETLLKSWMNLVPQSPEQLQSLLGGLFRPSAGGNPRKDSS